MKTITLQIDKKVQEKFEWLLSHFSNDEVKILEEKDGTKRFEPVYDHIPTSKVMQMEKEHKEDQKDHSKEYKTYKDNLE